MDKYSKHIQERRKYIRLETVFPVQFQLYSKETNKAVSLLKHGFTRNVSEGGICLEASELDEESVAKLQSSDTELGLYINMPYRREPIKAMAKLRWLKKIKEQFPNHYLIGIEYVRIPSSVRRQIIGYAKKLRRRPKIIAAIIFLLILFSGVILWHSHNINIRKNLIEKGFTLLKKQMQGVYEKRAFLKNKIYTLNLKSRALESRFAKSKNKIDFLNAKLAQVSFEAKNLTGKVKSQQALLAKQLIHWQDERNGFVKKLKELDISKQKVEKKLLELTNFGKIHIVRIRLANGSLITGQVLDCSSNTINLKVGLGSVGIGRDIIRSIKEVPAGEKINIEKEWIKQEEDARNARIKQEDLVKEYYDKGLVYFNGKWIKKEDAETIQKRLKQKESKIFQLIANQRYAVLSKKKKNVLLQKVLNKHGAPLISIKDKRIYLNGKLFFIKGMDYGIEYPKTSGGMQTFRSVPINVFENDFRMMKRAGVNTIRTYEPLPPKLLDLADKYRIMVIENVCYPSGNTDFNSQVYLDIFKKQVRKYVTRDKNRKCILMWSIWNDAPWVWNTKENIIKKYGFNTVNSFLKTLYDTAKKYDIKHPVTASNAIELKGENLGWDFLDVIGLNVYIGGYDWFLQEDAKRQIGEIKGIGEKYNKPVVILETGFSTFIKGQKQANVLTKQIKAIGTSVAGISIFQWADGWQKAGNKDKLDNDIEEHWGIVDGYRKPKEGYRIISRLFNAIPTESYGYNKGKTIEK